MVAGRRRGKDDRKQKTMGPVEYLCQIFRGLKFCWNTCSILFIVIHFNCEKVKLLIFVLNT
jgi:hypothetical protein